jgi:hypothetical protein
MIEALSSSETSVLTRASRRNIPQDVILYSHRRENLKSYTIKGIGFLFTLPALELRPPQSSSLKPAVTETALFLPENCEIKKLRGLSAS